MLQYKDLQVGMRVKFTSTVTGDIMTGKVRDINGITPGGVTVNLEPFGQLVVTDGTASLWDMELA